MKITKLEHSCLLVEMPDPVNRTVLFDPGEMSRSSVEAADLVYLDDIVITHGHYDHLSIPLAQQLLQKFPDVRITAPDDVVERLKQHDIFATHEEFEGMEFFDSPHADLGHLGETPQEIGVHYLGRLTHPGDSHAFTECKDILALPVTAPWGSTKRAVELAFELDPRPKYILPIHDWLWRDEFRTSMYDNLEKLFAEQGITFIKLRNGEPVVIDV